MQESGVPCGDPPFHDVVREASRLDHRIGVVEPSRFVETAGEDRDTPERHVRLFVKRAIRSQDTLATELRAVGQVLSLKHVQLLVGELWRVGRPAQEHDCEDVECVGDVRVA